MKTSETKKVKKTRQDDLTDTPWIILWWMHRKLYLKGGLEVSPSTCTEKREMSHLTFRG